jgi:hypothetical protein
MIPIGHHRSGCADDLCKVNFALRAPVDNDLQVSLWLAALLEEFLDDTHHTIALDLFPVLLVDTGSVDGEDFLTHSE